VSGRRPSHWFEALAVASLAAVSAFGAAGVARAETCDDHPEGPPPLGFFDKVRWDAGVRGELPFEASVGGRLAAGYIFHPNLDGALRVDYAYETGGKQTVVLSAEARIYWWFNYGGLGANVCGFKVRVIERLGGAPYVLLAAGAGADVAPRAGPVALGRLGIGWDHQLDRKRALFLELGGAVGTMAGAFASIGLRW